MGDSPAVTPNAPVMAPTTPETPPSTPVTAPTTPAPQPEPSTPGEQLVRAPADGAAVYVSKHFLIETTTAYQIDFDDPIGFQLSVTKENGRNRLGGTGCWVTACGPIHSIKAEGPIVAPAAGEPDVFDETGISTLTFSFTANLADGDTPYESGDWTFTVTTYVYPMNRGGKWYLFLQNATGVGLNYPGTSTPIPNYRLTVTPSDMPPRSLDTKLLLWPLPEFPGSKKAETRPTPKPQPKPTPEPPVTLPSDKVEGKDGIFVSKAFQLATQMAYQLPNKQIAMGFDMTQVGDRYKLTGTGCWFGNCTALTDFVAEGALADERGFDDDGVSKLTFAFSPDVSNSRRFQSPPALAPPHVLRSPFICSLRTSAAAPTFWMWARPQRTADLTGLAPKSVFPTTT